MLSNIFLTLSLILYLKLSSVSANDERFKEFSDAVRREDFLMADTLLKRGANMNAQSPKGKQTPLMQSVLHGKLRAVEYLLKKGADVTIAEGSGYTPMHGAAFQGRAEIAKMLHAYGVPLRETHADGFEPIHRACWGGEPRHTATVKFFLEKGVPVEDVFYPCMERSKSDETKKMLVDWMNARNSAKQQEKYEAEMEASKTEEDKAFDKMSEAIKKEDLKAIDKMLSNGFDINAKSPGALQTPLMQAILHGKEDSVAFLLKQNADVTIEEKGGFTPMHGAAFQGRAEIAKMLYEHGVDLRDKHADGNEPIHRACWGRDERHTDTVKYFLEAGVPITEVYDKCMERCKNDGTKQLLDAWYNGENKFIEL